MDRQTDAAWVWLDETALLKIQGMEIAWSGKCKENGSLLRDLENGKNWKCNEIRLMLLRTLSGPKNGTIYTTQYVIKVQISHRK